MLLTAAADPGARPPAPGSLHLVQAMVNTLSVENDHDLLRTRREAADWLAEAGLLPCGRQLSPAEHRALVGLREAVRQVLIAHTSRQPDPEAAGQLTTALMPSRLILVADPAGGASLRCADQDPFTQVIGAVAIAIAEAVLAGTWDRLKCCPGEHCTWAFYDRSASGRSRWCSMQLCGARAKMRAYRGRRRPAG